MFFFYSMTTEGSSMVPLSRMEGRNNGFDIANNTFSTMLSLSPSGHNASSRDGRWVLKPLLLLSSYLFFFLHPPHQHSPTTNIQQPQHPSKHSEKLPNILIHPKSKIKSISRISQWTDTGLLLVATSSTTVTTPAVVVAR